MSTTRWNTDAVVAVIKGIATDIIGEVKVKRQSPGGDVDTTNLVVRAANAPIRLFVCGFVTHFDGLEDVNDCEIEMVEVKDGGDSEGGLSCDDDASALFYARVSRALRNAGFVTVRRLDAYF